MLIRSTPVHGFSKTFLDTSPPSKVLSLHCKQINKTKKELDGQPLSLLFSTHALNYAASFPPAHLVFLELEVIHQHLDFKKTTTNLSLYHYLRLLNKE